MKRQTENRAVANTFPLPGIPVPVTRGRKPSGCALTGAQRQAKFRNARKLIETGEQIASTIRALADQFDLSESQVTRELLRFALCNKNWKQAGFPSLVTKKETK